MSIILIISILVRVVALTWSILLMRRLRDGRVGFLSLMLLVMTGRQVATLMGGPGPEGAWRLEWGAPAFEIPALAVSFMALLAVYGLEKLLTARRSTDESLRESEERFRQLAETFRGVVWLMDWKERKVLYISPGYEEIWGRRREGLEGEPFDWLAGIHPDDRERVRDLFLTQVARGGYDTEFRVLRADGSRRWIHDRGFPIKNAAGEVYRIGGLAADITKRKEAEGALRDSEAKRRSITESSPDYILTIDLMGRIQYLNRADFGLSVEDLIGMSVYDFVSAEDRKVMGDCFAHVMATGQVGRYEATYRLPEGEERIFDTQVGPVMRDGDVMGLTLSSRDVTQRKRAEDERERLAAELRQAQKLEAVGTLASGIAHDFNNLLTAIGGYTELAQNALAPDHPAARSLRMIGQASGQAVSVTRSLLTFARKTSTEKRPVDLAALIRESMGFLRRVLPASIEIKQQIPENGAVWIEGDSGLLQQVLMNLAVNARDAMPAGGRLSVAVSGPGGDSPAERSGATPSRSPEAVLTVEDSGSGIPQQEAARIFEPFYTTKPRGKGTGLGLSVVHGIVADHGGNIGVESEGSGGTRFRIRFPLCEPPPVLPAEIVAGDGPDPSGGLVLVAEDNEHVRDIVVQAVESAGYRAVPVGDGAAAVEAFHRHREAACLVVLDLDLPERSGLSCLEEIRCHHPDLPVLIITGNAGQVSPTSLGGADHLLEKPFRPGDLLAAITGILHRPGDGDATH